MPVHNNNQSHSFWHLFIERKGYDLSMLGGALCGTVALCLESYHSEKDREELQSHINEYMQVMTSYCNTDVL
jgi:hypothetical protein